MPEKFDYHARDLLRDAWRREHLDPDRFWLDLGLQAGQTVVDVGAGIGYFALPAARRVGPAGRVHALDVSPYMAAHVAREADREGLTQLVAAVSGEHTLPVASGVADLALVAFVIHEVVDGARLLADVGRVLKPSGRLVLLDWSVDADEPENLPRRLRYAPATVQFLVRKAGLTPGQPRMINAANWLLEASLPARAAG